MTLVDWDELHKWKTISDDLGLDMPEAPETYSTSAHLYSDLEIPADARGRLPHSQRTRAGLDAEYVDTEGDHGGRRRRDRDKVRGRRDDAVPADEARPARQRKARTRSRGGVLLAADGSPVEAALTGVDAAGTDTEPVAAEAAGARPGRRCGHRRDQAPPASPPWRCPAPAWCRRRRRRSRRRPTRAPDAAAS